MLLIQFSTLIAVAGSCLPLLASAHDSDNGSMGSGSARDPGHFHQVITQFAVLNSEASLLLDVDLDGRSYGYLHQKFGVQDAKRALEVLEQQHSHGQRVLDMHQQLPMELEQEGKTWQKTELEHAARALISTQRQLANKIWEIKEKMEEEKPKEVEVPQAGKRRSRASRHRQTVQHTTHHATAEHHHQQEQQHHDHHSPQHKALGPPVTQKNTGDYPNIFC